MERNPRRFFDAKVIFGMAIIVAGVLLLLHNLDIIPYVNVWEWWPLILILIGVGHLLQPAEDRQSWNGLLLVIVGAIILIWNLDLFYFDIGDIWPIFLILIGFMILRHTAWGGKHRLEGNDYINLSFIMGGGDYNFSSKELKGGRITAIMGGGKIDLRECRMYGSSIVIDTFSFWGGIELIVPRDWTVNLQGMPILGGMENKTSTAGYNGEGLDIPQTENQLIIKGMAVMGGVEVKN